MRSITQPEQVTQKRHVKVKVMVCEQAKYIFLGKKDAKQSQICELGPKVKVQFCF